MGLAAVVTAADYRRGLMVAVGGRGFVPVFDPGRIRVSGDRKTGKCQQNKH